MRLGYKIFLQFEPPVEHIKDYGCARGRCARGNCTILILMSNRFSSITHRRIGLRIGLLSAGMEWHGTLLQNNVLTLSCVKHDGEHDEINEELRGGLVQSGRAMCPTVQNYFPAGKNIRAGVFFFSPF